MSLPVLPPAKGRPGSPARPMSAGVSCLGFVVVGGLSVFGFVGTCVLLSLHFLTLRIEGSMTPAEARHDAVAGPIVWAASLVVAATIGVAVGRLWFDPGRDRNP